MILRMGKKSITMYGEKNVAILSVLSGLHWKCIAQKLRVQEKLVILHSIWDHSSDGKYIDNIGYHDNRIFIVIKM